MSNRVGPLRTPTPGLHAPHPPRPPCCAGEPPPPGRAQPPVPQPGPTRQAGRACPGMPAAQQAAQPSACTRAAYSDALVPSRASKGHLQHQGAASNLRRRGTPRLPACAWLAAGRAAPRRGGAPVDCNQLRRRFHPVCDGLDLLLAGKRVAERLQFLFEGGGPVRQAGARGCRGPCAAGQGAAGRAVPRPRPAAQLPAAPAAAPGRPASQTSRTSQSLMQVRERWSTAPAAACWSARFSSGTTAASSAASPPSCTHRKGAGGGWAAKRQQAAPAAWLQLAGGVAAAPARAAQRPHRTCFRAASIAWRTRTLARARHVMWLGLLPCSASSFCSASAMRLPLAYCASSLRASSAPGAACAMPQGTACWAAAGGRRRRRVGGGGGRAPCASARHYRLRECRGRDRRRRRLTRVAAGAACALPALLVTARAPAAAGPDPCLLPMRDRCTPAAQQCSGLPCAAGSIAAPGWMSVLGG